VTHQNRVARKDKKDMKLTVRPYRFVFVFQTTQLHRRHLSAGKCFSAPSCDVSGRDESRPLPTHPRDLTTNASERQQPVVCGELHNSKIKAIAAYFMTLPVENWSQKIFFTFSSGLHRKCVRFI